VLKNIGTAYEWEPDRFVYRAGPVPPGTGRTVRFPTVSSTLLIPGPWFCALASLKFAARTPGWIVGGAERGGPAICSGIRARPVRKKLASVGIQSQWFATDTRLTMPPRHAGPRSTVPVQSDRRGSAKNLVVALTSRDPAHSPPCWAAAARWQCEKYSA
jgi:hypothetical protein